MWRRGIIFILPLLFFAAVGGYAVWIGIIGGQEVLFTTLDRGSHTPGPSLASASHILIVASPQDIDSLANALDMNVHDLIYQRFLANFQHADYQQFILILVLQEQEAPGASVEVQRITHLNNQIAVHAKFAEHFGGGPTEATDPYHLITIPKSGLQGRDIHFKLTNGFVVVAETTHFIP